MTALRDRPSDADADELDVPWDARPIVGDRRGLPWWAAVLLAFILAAIGAVVDMKMSNTLGWVFRICYFVGSVGAVCAVQRRSLFGPMVQPPLVLAVTVPAVVLLVSGTPASSDTLGKALAVGTPLINGFPTMAVTTGFTLAVGIFRFYQERNPESRRKDKAPDRPSARQRPSTARRPGEDGRPRPADDGRARPADESRPRSGDDGRPRPGQPNRGGRGQRPSERSGGQRRPTGENPLPPAGRRQPPDELPRRSDPGGRSGQTPPPPGARRPRGPAPDDADRRRSGGQPGADPRGRRMPPRSGDPRSGGPRGDGARGDLPRRAPGRGTPPPRRRPWDDA
ncbi:DUF6542 domain-containing protein [Amycolatopsis taiwanensis]|uniref:DUF6542 domain-containing protein n=1 Tax=Amycolatopsis taiwanensis TaxID=342230 RepID=A0A9W6QYS0_9PSEU|nr:DUF6542 domain-containing protein [Amycolatopsis taiwanensis]GLY64435.1 hypothetical protein Atai01_10540 [Amycolatopsis taiwanensis]